MTPFARIRKKLEDTHRLAREVREIPYTGLILLNYLKGWGIGEARNLDGVCHTTKCVEDDKCIVLQSELQPMSSLKWHFHDCAEDIVILKGSIQFETSERAPFDVSRGKIQVKPFVSHRISNKTAEPAIIQKIFFK